MRFKKILNVQISKCVIDLLDESKIRPREYHGFDLGIY